MIGKNMIIFTDSSDEDDTLDENIAFYGETMSVGTIDDDFVMPTNYYDDHDWGDNYDASCDLGNLFEPHDESITDKNICKTVESGFGEVINLVDVNPTILKDYKVYMHEDHEENILYDSYIVEFDYDPTCNYFERGKYGYRNLYVTKSPLFMLKLLMFLSSSLHVLEIVCHNNLFAYKVPMHRKWVRLKFVCYLLIDALFVLQFLSFI